MAAPARQLVATQRVELPVGREQQQLVGRLRVEDETAAIAFLVFDIGVGREMALGRADPALLGAHDRNRLALDHGFERDDVRRGRIAEAGPPPAQIGQPGEPLLNLLDLGGDGFLALVLALEQRVQVLLFRPQLVVLGADFHFLEFPQGTQPHVEDRFGLRVGQLEGRHQLGLRLILLADDPDDLVEIEIGDQVTCEDLEAALDLVEPVTGAAFQNDHAMIEEALQHLAQTHHARRPGRVQHVHVQGEPDLKIGLLEQHLHQHLGIDRAGFRLQNQPDVFRRFIQHIPQDRELLRFDQLGDPLDELGFLDLIGNLRDHDPVLAVAEIFDLPFRAQPEAAAPGSVGFEDRCPWLHQHAAGRKVRSRHQIDKLFHRCVGRLDEMQQRVAQLVGVMRRDAGRHADRDAGGPVREQIWERGGQDDGFLLFAVIGRTEIDRILVDAVEQRLGDGREARFRVSHRGRVIAVDIAEVPLPVDQRIAHGEILRETHQGVIDRLIAVGVILTDDVADHAGAFLEARIRIELELPHGKEKPPVDGLQAIAHIGQRARHDRAQGVGQITRAQRIAERRIANVFLGQSWRCHGRNL